ncbi:MAG: hypothetical protein R3A51_00810 [Nannocystaceae bacterium]
MLASHDGGEYVAERREGKWSLGYRGLFAKPILTDASEGECTLRALEDASSEYYLVTHVDWDMSSSTAYAHGRGFEVRVRKTPWPGVASLFVLSDPPKPRRFDHLLNGPIRTVMIQAAKVVLGRARFPALPETSFVTDAAMFQWEYTEDTPRVIAVATRGDARFELCFGERGSFELGFNDGDIVDVVDTAKTLSDLMVPRTMPTDRQRKSRTFVELFADRAGGERDREGRIERADDANEIRARVDAQPRDAELLAGEFEDVRPKEANRSSGAAQRNMETVARLQQPSEPRRDVESVIVPASLPSTLAAASPTKSSTRWGASLLSRLPSSQSQRIREAVAWAVDAIERAVATTHAREKLGSQKALLAYLTEANTGQPPERHCFGEALVWLSTQTPVVTRLNRQKWSLKLSEVAG